MLLHLLLPEKLLDEFVKSLRHPSATSRWLRWCGNYSRLKMRWSACRKNLPRSSLNVSLHQLSDWSSMDRSGLSLWAMRQTHSWTKPYTVSWMFGRRLGFRWISEWLCIQRNCPKPDFIAEICLTGSFISFAGKAFSTQILKTALGLKNLILSFQFLFTPYAWGNGVLIKPFFWHITYGKIWVNLLQKYTPIGCGVHARSAINLNFCSSERLINLDKGIYRLVGSEE